MARVKKPLFSISAGLVILAVIIGASCKFSFAESKRPSRGSISFGAETKPAVALPQSQEFERFRSVFAEVAAKVTPTVVQVIPTKIDTVVFYNNPFYQFFGEDFFGDDPFGQFFGNPRQQQPRRRQEPPVTRRPRRQEGLGSGVIVSKDGYILTNNHVVGGADEIVVKLNDGRSFQAEIVGTDSLTDVAVIKITEKVKDLPVAYLGDSEKMRPGDWVLAVGNPFSLSSTVTSGIVSAVGRATQGNSQMFQNFIQTDAAINPGNSGGALVNIDGELIGINTMIYTRSGGFMGIGFAVPINMARWVMEDLIYEGKVTRGWLGVTLQPTIDDATREVLGLDRAIQGVLIADVLKGEPAEKAGIRRGDFILSVDGRRVNDANELRNAVAGINPGKEVPIVLIRNGKEVTVRVKLSERDEARVAKASTNNQRQEPEKGQESGQSSSFDSFGLTVAEITPELRNRFGLSNDAQGVVITAAANQAAEEGFREGDVVREIRIKGKELIATTSVREYNRAVRQIKPGEPVMLTVQRGANTFLTTIRVRK